MISTSSALAQKRAKLESLLRGLGSVIVAFSGGVDSTLLLAVARSVLGGKVLAVTAQSDSLPERELREAERLARQIGAQHLIIQTHEMETPGYRDNTAERCYFCKSELYARLAAIAAERNFAGIVNGINLDDLGDYRPGIAAATEAKVRSPLSDAGFTKNDVRELSREFGLPTWEKPAMACLSSRIPYGQTITTDKLRMIEAAEDFLLALGFKQVRVRHHGDIARIELAKNDIPRFYEGDVAARVAARLKEIGFKYITLDVEGYRTGSLNEALPKKPAS